MLWATLYGAVTRLHLNIFSHLIVVPGPVVDTCMAEVGGKPAERDGERDRVNSVQPLRYCPSPESAVDESRPADREMNESQCKYTS